MKTRDLPAARSDREWGEEEIGKKRSLMTRDEKVASLRHVRKREFQRRRKN